jgi:hypothetical protein
MIAKAAMQATVVGRTMDLEVIMVRKKEGGVEAEK